MWIVSGLNEVYQDPSATAIIKPQKDPHLQPIYLKLYFQHTSKYSRFDKEVLLTLIYLSIHRYTFMAQNVIY